MAHFGENMNRRELLKAAFIAPIAVVLVPQKSLVESLEAIKTVPYEFWVGDVFYNTPRFNRYITNLEVPEGY